MLHEQMLIEANSISNNETIVPGLPLKRLALAFGTNTLQLRSNICSGGLRPPNAANNTIASGAQRAPLQCSRKCLSDITALLLRAEQSETKFRSGF
jgi:hypothetical protein